MDRKIKDKLITVIVIVVASSIIGYGIYWRVATNPAKAEVNEQTAVCLASKDIKFYGTYYCPHCKEQKDILGGYINSINYIECTENPQVCSANNVQVVPTWVFPDGTRREGTLPLEEILQLAGCQQ